MGRPYERDMLIGFYWALESNEILGVLIYFNMYNINIQTVKGREFETRNILQLFMCLKF